jgi:hypothetical protein
VTGIGSVWFVVPEGVDDAERVSGGNVYDRQVRDGLRRLGWDVRMLQAADRTEVASALTAVGDRGVVLVDGLVAAWAPASIEAAGMRTRLVVIAHMVNAAFPGATFEAVDGELRALRCASRVVATSEWSAAELVRRGLVESERVMVATPGARAGAGPRDPAHDLDLLCVGAVARHKGQDLLLDALEQLTDLDWTCTIVGSRSVDPQFAVLIASAAAGFGGRVRLTGVLDGDQLDLAYDRAGLLVAPSRAESFGMAIADARGRGLPVVATEMGGIPEAVAGGGAVLVPCDDPGALAGALREWMTDSGLRERLRREAAAARSQAPRWADTVARIDEVLSNEILVAG